MALAGSTGERNPRLPSLTWWPRSEKNAAWCDVDATGQASADALGDEAPTSPLLGQCGRDREGLAWARDMAGVGYLPVL